MGGIVDTLFRQGDFARPEALSDPINCGRYLFLEAIRQCAYEVLEELRASVFDQHYSAYTVGPPYGLKTKFAKEMHPGRSVAAAMAAGRYPDTFSWPDLQQARTDFYPELLPVRAALESWAQKFHLRTDWMLDIALHTLQQWEITPSVVYGPDDEGSLPEVSAEVKEIDPETAARRWDEAFERARTMVFDESDDEGREHEPVKLFLVFAGPFTSETLITSDEIEFRFDA